MTTIDNINIDEETINHVGLQLSSQEINAEIAANSRVFEYPHLKDVFIMESDLYGNPMPKGSCFLSFYSQHGLIGRPLKVETLRNATVEDIKKMVETNNEG
jgi:hypothetical protein